jgi:fusion and transport protein UGO1
MSHPSTDGVNPLRPYYVPPTIGEHVESSASAAHASSAGAGAARASTTTATPFWSGGGASGGNGTAAAAAASAATTAGGRYASRARDMFSDLDDWNNLSDQSPSVMRTVKGLVNELVWKYTSVLMAQPFDVAKTILQVRLQDDAGALGAAVVLRKEEEETRPRIASPRGSTYDRVGLCCADFSRTIVASAPESC